MKKALHYHIRRGILLIQINSEKKKEKGYAFQHPGSRGSFGKYLQSKVPCLRFDHAIFFSRRFAPVRA